MIVEPGLLDHPKFLRLQRRLGDRALHVVIRLWSHCQAEQRGEKWRAADAEYVEAVARWNGDDGQAYKALCECGFIEEREGFVIVHDWNEHNSSLRNSWKNGIYGGRPKKKKAQPAANPPETHGFPTGDPQPPQGEPVGPQRREEKRREEKTSSSLPPSTVPGSGEVVVASSDSGPLSGDELRQVDEVWKVWPKKVDILGGQMAIRRAIQRHGFDRVLGGVKLIAEAEALTASTPRGRFLPRPEEFFDHSRYLDDPAQYGPRSAAVANDPAALRREVADLKRQLDEHPGNPNNTAGSFERKSAAAAEYAALRDRLIETQQKLNGALVESR